MVILVIGTILAAMFILWFTYCKVPKIRINRMLQHLNASKIEVLIGAAEKLGITPQHKIERVHASHGSGGTVRMIDHKKEEIPSSLWKYADPKALGMFLGSLVFDEYITDLDRIADGLFKFMTSYDKRLAFLDGFAARRPEYRGRLLLSRPLVTHPSKHIVLGESMTRQINEIIRRGALATGVPADKLETVLPA